MSDNKKIEFSAETLALLHKMMKRYPEGKQKSAVIPVLHIAQAEFDGWLSAPDRKSTRLNSSHIQKSRMPSSA